MIEAKAKDACFMVGGDQVTLVSSRFTGEVYEYFFAPPKIGEIVDRGPMLYADDSGIHTGKDSTHLFCRVTGEADMKRVREIYNQTKHGAYDLAGGAFGKWMRVMYD